MLPFLASSVVVRKADGSEVKINGDASSDETDGESSATTAHTGTASGPSKHRESQDGGFAAVPIVAMVLVFLWLIIKALMAPFTQRAARRARSESTGAEALSEEEQAVLLKLQRTITQMERRIESLETILIDKHRTKENYGSKI